MPDQIAGSVYILLLLLLVGSALVTRRLPRGRIISLGAIWLAVILSLWIIITVVQKIL